MFCFFLLSPLVSSAQGESLRRIIKQDTITLTGKVVDIFGKPVPHIGLLLRSTDKYDRSLGTTTDVDGYFKIHGAFLYDTIRLESNKVIFYMNKGSRFVTIQLPEVTSKEIQAEVKAKRFKPKTIPSIKKYILEDFYCALPYISLDAEYPGGPDAFQKIISTNLKYPAGALKYNIEGNVKLKFKVLKDGSLSGFVVLDSLGYGCEEEAIRVVKLSRKWRPAIRSSRPIEFEQTISVFFHLED
jgi:TonB family protein